MAAAVPVALGCALATAQPALPLPGQLAVIGAGLLAALVLWHSAPRTAHRRAWRLLAVAPLLPVSGVALTLLVTGLDPVPTAVLRWAPTLPGYVVATVALLALVDRHRLRAGPRIAVEVALFLVACLIVVSLMVVGPAGSWSRFAVVEQLVLGSAVVATAAVMAAALTLVTVIEAGRRATAVVLLAGTVLLGLGRALATSALLAGTPSVPAGLARCLIAAGILSIALAALLDSRPAGPTAHERLGGDLSALLPQLALMAAATTVAAVALGGSRPTAGAVVGMVVCVVLTVVQRMLGHREEQRLNARLSRSEAYFRSVVQSAGDAVVILDDDLRVGWASPVLERAIGDRAGELVGRPIVDSVHPDDAAALKAALVAGGLLTVRLPDAVGEWRYLEVAISDLRQIEDVGALVLHCRDMTERHAREQALQAVAYTDPKTGLPNRAGFLTLVRETLAAGAPSTTLLMIELDGLEAARESAGRETVSTVVTEIGRRLRATVRGEDEVVRMGGGAFAVLAEGSDADVDRVAARCLSVVEQPVVTPAGILELTAGVGVVPLEDGLGVEELLARAEVAVRAAHEAGPGWARRYSAALGDAAARSTRLRHDLQGARARDELFLMFEPIVSLEEQRITGLEAHLRWKHAELGEIAPAEFLPLAARAGLIGELLRWALEETARTVAGLPDGGRPPLRVGIKIPIEYLATGALVGDVEQALRVSGLGPERLVLQINAPAVMSDGERMGQDVASLRLMGVHVALDGFGSGSSGLAHLTRLPIDILRLDRSLISRIDRDPQSRALCESIVGIGRALGLDVLAEGVETPAQLAALCGFGCGFAQGFLISRPLPLAGFMAVLAENAGELWPGLVGSR